MIFFFKDYPVVEAESAVDKFAAPQKLQVNQIKDEQPWPYLDEGAPTKPEKSLASGLDEQ